MEGEGAEAEENSAEGGRRRRSVMEEEKKSEKGTEKICGEGGRGEREGEGAR